MPDALLTALLPSGIEPWAAATLVAVSFFTSGLTAAMGLGGGVAMLGVMANLLPPIAVIPIHGVVQLGSNAGRTLVLWRYMDRHILGWFTLGAVLGAAIGAQLVVTLPGWLLRLILGLFILYSVWAPRMRLRALKARGLALGGVVATFLTMFVGATGPFVGALRPVARMERQTLVGTLAACMSVQHAFKIVAFGLLGFAFGPWLALLAAMIAAGFLGTLAGTRILRRTPPQRFRLAFRLLLTALALNLLFDAGAALLG